MVCGSVVRSMVCSLWCDSIPCMALVMMSFAVTSELWRALATEKSWRGSPSCIQESCRSFPWWRRSESPSLNGPMCGIKCTRCCDMFVSFQDWISVMVSSVSPILVARFSKVSDAEGWGGNCWMRAGWALAIFRPARCSLLRSRIHSLRICVSFLEIPLISGH